MYWQQVTRGARGMYESGLRQFACAQQLRRFQVNAEIKWHAGRL